MDKRKHNPALLPNDQLLIELVQARQFAQDAAETFIDDSSDTNFEALKLKVNDLRWTREAYRRAVAENNRQEGRKQRHRKAPMN